MIDIEIYGFNCRVTSKMRPDTERDITELCRYEFAGAEYSDKVKSGDWDGYIRLFRNRRFPVGLLDRIEMALELLDEDYNIFDHRPVFGLNPIQPLWDLRGYQSPIVERAIATGHGLIQAPTGSGKTVMMMHLLCNYGRPSLVVVPATELIDQTLDKMASVAGVMGSHISTQDFYDGVPGSSFSEGSTLHTHQTGCPDGCSATLEMPWYVMTWQTLNSAQDKFSAKKAKEQRRNLESFIDTVDVVCGDEIHFAGADKVYKVFEKIPARYRFGFSATPWRTDGAELKMHGAVGDTIKGISVTDLVKIGRESDWTEGLVQPIIQWWKPGVTDRYMDGGWQDVYRKYIVENRIRNTQIAEKAIDAADKDRITLVMCTQIDHGDTLQTMIPGSEFINGTRSKNKRRDMTKRFAAGKIPIMISSSVWNVGVDFPIIEALVFASPHKNAAINAQRAGRGYRVCPEIGKVDCLVFDTMDEARYLKEWSIQRYDQYAKEKAIIQKGVGNLGRRETAKA
jgi:superfamily II DNA or RNA helicase